MRDGNHEDCRMVTIGNGCKGISVYPEDKRERELFVPWRDIVKISYKNDKFRMIYQPEEVLTVLYVCVFLPVFQRGSTPSSERSFT